MKTYRLRPLKTSFHVPGTTYLRAEGTPFHTRNVSFCVMRDEPYEPDPNNDSPLLQALIPVLMGLDSVKGLFSADHGRGLTIDHDASLTRWQIYKLAYEVMHRKSLRDRLGYTLLMTRLALTTHRKER